MIVCNMVTTHAGGGILFLGEKTIHVHETLLRVYFDRPTIFLGVFCLTQEVQFVLSLLDNS